MKTYTIPIENNPDLVRQWQVAVQTGYHSGVGMSKTCWVRGPWAIKRTYPNDKNSFDFKQGISEIITHAYDLYQGSLAPLLGWIVEEDSVWIVQRACQHVDCFPGLSYERMDRWRDRIMQLDARDTMGGEVNCGLIDGDPYVYDAGTKVSPSYMRSLDINLATGVVTIATGYGHRE